MSKTFYGAKSKAAVLEGLAKSRKLITVAESLLEEIETDKSPDDYGSYDDRKTVDSILKIATERIKKLGYMLTIDCIDELSDDPVATVGPLSENPDDHF